MTSSEQVSGPDHTDEPDRGRDRISEAGGPMANDAADIDARIAEAEAEVAQHPPGGAGRRSASTRLASALAARYVQHGGPDDDRARAARLARDVLADDGATPEQRQMMSLLLPTLTMVQVTPASALRFSEAGLDAEALRRTEQWRQENADPAILLAGFGQLFSQLSAIEDADSLPPQIRSMLAMVKGATGLLSDVSRPGWDGTVAPEVTAELRAAMADTPPDVPGADLLRGLVVWVEGFDRSAERESRVGELEAIITDLSEDSLLTPVLRADLAKELARRSDRGRASSVAALLEQAVEGMAESHPLYDDTVSMLAGALVATAAEDSTLASRERAEQVVAEVLAREADSDTQRGEHLFLTALVVLLPGRRHGGRDVEAALDALIACLDLLSGDHPLRPAAVGQLGAVLADRSLTAGLLEDGSLSVSMLDRAVAAVEGEDDAAPEIVCIAGITRVNQAMRTGNGRGLEAAAAALRVAHDALPPDNRLMPNVALVLAIADLRVAVDSGRGLRDAVAAVRAAATGRPLAGVPEMASRAVGDTADALAALLDDDPEAVRATVDRMEAALVDTDAAATAFERPAQLVLLGKALLAWLGTGTAPDDAARRAVEYLEEAHELLGPDAGPLRADLLRDLATALRATGARSRSRRCAAEALELMAGTVLLQSRVEHGLVAAQGAAADAARLSGWCLADGDLPGALAAVELGRGLVLRASTAVTRVADVLVDHGHDELARRWSAHQDVDVTSLSDLAEVATGNLSSVQVDAARAAGALRLEVLERLRAIPEAGFLFRPPTAEEIGRSLASVGADALVHLVAGTEDTPGRLLLVDRSGAVTAVDAPELRDAATGPLSTYLRLPGPGKPGYTAVTWHAALSRLCEWAAPALLDPLLGVLRGRHGSGPSGTPRVVLVPGGRLGAVPWAAAHCPDDMTARRYACQDLVLSSAVSAGQFVDAVARPPLGVSSGVPVLISDPTGTMDTAPEVVALRAAIYPDAVLLGQVGGGATDGAGTPEQLLAQLPGSGASAPIVHVACHAVASDDPENSWIALTEPLTVTRVLRQAARVPREAAGPVVVCSACETDFTRSSYDEALTLATAFLSSGAGTVVGSLWTVFGRYTGVLMFAFHHFLRSEHLPPADALRAAQLWALDGEREALPGMPPDLAGRARREALRQVEMWAAFTHHGR